LFCQKITKPNCKYRKATQNTSVQKAAHKMLVKFTPVMENCATGISFETAIEPTVFGRFAGDGDNSVNDFLATNWPS